MSDPITELPAHIAEILAEKEAEIAKLERKNQSLTNLLKQEITHKESISRALRYHLNKNEELVNTVPWIVLQISKKLSYIEVNRYYASFFDTDPNDFAEKLVGSFGEPLIFKSKIEAFINSETETTRRDQLFFVLNNVQKHFLLIFFRNKIDGNTSLIGIDISERAEAEAKVLITKQRLQIINQKLIEKVEEAESLAEQAQAASIAKSNFLSTMSHELRTPLNGIIGMASLLADSGLDEEFQEYADIILTSADSLLNIISHILDISKIEAGKVELEEIPFDMYKVIDDIKRMFAHVAGDKGLDLSCEIDASIPDELIGDPIRIKQVVINLLNNAIKFTSQGSIFVHVDCLEKTDEHIFLRISVKDTGIGISAEAASRLFTPFYQADSSITRKYGGTGLGLAICKQLVELMQGTIEVESVPEEGSTFSFSALLKQPVFST